MPTNNWASALKSTYAPPQENSLLAQTGDMAMFMDWYCKRQGITHLTLQDLEGATAFRNRKILDKKDVVKKQEFMFIYPKRPKDTTVIFKSRELLLVDGFEKATTATAENQMREKQGKSVLTDQRLIPTQTSGRMTKHIRPQAFILTVSLKDQAKMEMVDTSFPVESIIKP
ncbi:hypothetical protein Tco_0368459 [Tanacetum coccineum]